MKKTAIFILFVVAASGCSLLFCLRGRVLWDSDQAVVGLAARDIIHRGALPVFYSGQEFLGAIETYWVAVVFALFSESVCAYRVATAFVLVLTVVVVWAYSRESYGERAGFFAGLYLSLGPPFLFYRALAGSGYAVILLIGALILWMLVRAEKRAREGLSPAFEILGVAFLLGVGFWTSYLCLAYFSGVLVAAFMGIARRRITLLLAITSGLAFGVGSAPWWLRNLHTGWASFEATELAKNSLWELPKQVSSLLVDGLPSLYGALPFRTGRYLFPGALLVTGAFVLAILFQAVKLACADGKNLAVYMSRVLLVVAVSAPVLALSIGRTDFTEPRYLEPMYLATASLFGSMAAGRDVAVWLRAIVVSCAVVLNLGGHLREPQRADPLIERGLDWPVVRQLRARGIEAVYASYWTAYLVTFASNSSIVATPFGPWNVTRRPDDRARVDASASPGILLEREEAEQLEKLLNGSHVVFEEQQIDGRTLFTRLPAGPLGALRACLCVPSTL